ncbi:prostaglandin E synthase [Halyomorpha halys]|uniref:prostaglandin E synthase n=1 Tax=Halyomorpha halys TaxID=286706 RepID=UPI0006D4E0C8|nr:prostaglandin E synthase-like isoform X2 [Halyomorpha halys]
MFDLTGFQVKVYLLCSGVLSLKMLFMALIIGRLRLKKEIFISPEDTVRRGRVSYKDPDIERVRRAHLNDLENIPIFLSTGAMYLLTKPHPLLAAALFLLFTVARLYHTFVYAIRVTPQPARMRAFRIAYIVNICIILLTLLKVIFP